MPADRFDHLFIAPRSFDAALAFYRDGLGWVVAQQWASADGRGALLDGGGVKVMLAEGHAPGDGLPSGADRATGPTLHLRVDDLDARFAAIGGAVRVNVPPGATHWGTRWFVVADPDGNRIAFEQTLDDAS